MTPKRILIVSGEPSGDLHASNLVKELNKLRPGLSFYGLGGKLSKEAGVDTVFDISGLAIVGLSGVIRNIFTIGKVFKLILDRVGREKPDLAIVVDYPGFNLRLTKELKKRGIPVVYYISPQIWAWGRNRVNIIRECVTKMVVLFEFEVDFYKQFGITAECSGHPLIDTVRTKYTKEEVFARLGLSKDKTTIVLLPGSRKSEVSNFLRVLVGAAKLIDKKLSNTQFIVSKHPGLPDSLFDNVIKGCGANVVKAEGMTHDIVAASDFAIVASGTATLETSILGTPYVLVYKSNLLNYIAYKIVVDIPYLGIANIMAGKKIVPEFLQYDMTPEKISSTVVDLLTDKEKLSKMKSDLAAIRASLGSPGASSHAARLILPLL